MSWWGYSLEKCIDGDFLILNQYTGLPKSTTPLTTNDVAELGKPVWRLIDVSHMTICPIFCVVSVERNDKQREMKFLFVL